MRRLKATLKEWPVVRDLVGRYRLAQRYDNIMHPETSPSLLSDPGQFHVGEIEINRNCNLNCVMCQSEMSTRPQINMEPGLFERAVELVAERGGRRTTLHTIGEPLINRDLPIYLDILRRHGVSITLSTNGLLLKKKLDLLMEYSDVINSIRFSIDGARRETYEKIRIRGKFDQLLENLDYFKQVTDGKSPFRRVRISSIVSTDTLPELGYHMDFYSKYVPMKDIDLNLVSGLSPDNSYFLETSILKNHIVPWPPCDQLFSSTIHVLNDGRISACCRDYNADLLDAELGRETVAVDDLINNERLLTLRRQHLEQTIPDDSLCATCFRVDPRVSALFSTFVETLVARYSDCWEIDAMQRRFENFFEAFGNGFPSKSRFASLV